MVKDDLRTAAKERARFEIAGYDICIVPGFREAIQVLVAKQIAPQIVIISVKDYPPNTSSSDRNCAIRCAFANMLSLLREQNEKLQVILFVPEHAEIPIVIKNDKKITVVHSPFSFEELLKMVDDCIGKKKTI